MSKYHIRTFFIIVVFCPTLILAQSADPERLFSEGKLLIESNCADCYGSTKENFGEGISKVVSALDAGYEDKLNAYTILAEAYRVFALVYIEPDSEEQELFYEKFRETYLKILVLNPTENEMRIHYASSFKNEEKRIFEYREILKINPNHFGAQFAVGNSLFEKYLIGKGLGQPLDPTFLKQGIEEIGKAIEIANLDEVKNLEFYVVNNLRGFDLVEEAELVAQMVKNRIEKLERQ